MAHRYRTREVKPGVYETQSAEYHAAKQVGIGFLVIVGLGLVVMVIKALFSGDPNSIAGVLTLAGLVGILVLVRLVIGRFMPASARGESEPRRPGPWD